LGAQALRRVRNLGIAKQRTFYIRKVQSTKQPSLSPNILGPTTDPQMD